MKAFCICVTLQKVFYQKIYPTAEEVPKLYGLPKIHKPGFPLRPIVSSIGSITYQASKYLAGVLGRFVGHTQHHIQNSQEFAEKISDLHVAPGQKLVSYDVTALFTSIPVEDAITTIRERLERGSLIKEITPLSVDQVVALLQFVLTTTYFTYKEQFYQQRHGAAMGSPVSPIVANLYMEEFERKALTTYHLPPEIWYRYVDDTFTKQHEEEIGPFTEHLNSIDPSIQFTVEIQQENKLAFLDTLVHVDDEGNTKVTVYRKPTHTDQYLQFDSNHHLQHKRSVVRTLFHRADTIVTEPEDRDSEKQHVKEALQANGYKPWMFNIPPPQVRLPPDSQERRVFPQPLPYLKGLTERLAKTFRKFDTKVYYKPINTIRSQLVHPKDKTTIDKKCSVIYQIDCADCDSVYVGETARSLSARVKEHTSTRRASLTAVGEHCKNTGHIMRVVQR